MLTLECNSYKISVSNEPTYSFNSSDNRRRYLRETRLDSDKYQFSSVHGLVVERHGEIIASHLLATSGGATGVHDHSLVIVGESCVLAVGPYLVSLSLPTLDVLWSLKADAATVFGIYLSNDGSFLLSHGELTVSRVSLEGEVLWQAGGADIFTEGFSVHDTYVRAVDFEHREYRFDLVTGDSSAG